MPGMIRNPGSHLDQTQDQPFDGPPHSVASNVELPKHVKKIVCENPHLQSGFVRLEFRTTGLVPTERVLALLDPVLDLCPAIVNLDHLAGSKSGVCHNEPNPGEQLPLMPLDLANHSPGPVPASRLVVEVDQFCLDPRFRRSLQAA